MTLTLALNMVNNKFEWIFIFFLTEVFFIDVCHFVLQSNFAAEILTYFLFKLQNLFRFVLKIRRKKVINYKLRFIVTISGDFLQVK